MSMSQRTRVLNALEKAPDGVCARFFVYQMHPGIPRAAARINDLRRQGFEIWTEPCQWTHGPDTNPHVQYRLITEGAMI